jgi:pSer/pThr/pTyr-binding forkhead associated (FHA) protein
MRLLVQSGPRAGEVIDVAGEWLVLGRDAGCDVVLDDEQVSAQHAAIARQEDGAYVVRDLGSSSGTFVNGVRITEPTALHGDEQLRIGATVLHVSIMSEAPPPRGPWKWLAIAVGSLAIAALGAALAVVFTGGGTSADKAIATQTGTGEATATGEITVPPALTETVTVTETEPATTPTGPGTTEAPTEPATTEEPPATTEEPPATTEAPPATTEAPPATTESPTTPETTEPGTTGDDGGGGGGSDPEAELLAHVPSEIRGSCATQTDMNPQGAVASVICSASDGGARVVYWQFEDAGSMQRWYSGHVDASGAQAGVGDCVEDEVAEEPWTADGQPAGRVLCAPAADRDLRAIAWTSDELAIGSIAATAGLDRDARERVYDFWLTAGPTP